MVSTYSIFHHLRVDNPDDHPNWHRTRTPVDASTEIRRSRTVILGQIRQRHSAAISQALVAVETLL